MFSAGKVVYLPLLCVQILADSLSIYSQNTFTVLYSLKATSCPVGHWKINVKVKTATGHCAGYCGLAHNVPIDFLLIGE